MKSERPYTKYEKDCLKLIGEDPILLSLLYDIDLMPEQLEIGSKEWHNMIIICDHWMERK